VRGGGSGRRLHALVSRPPRCVKLPRSGTHHSAASNQCPSRQRRSAPFTALANVVFPSSGDGSLLPSDRSSTAISLAYSDDLDLAASATSRSAQRAGRSCRHRIVLTAPAVGACGGPDLPAFHSAHRTATDHKPCLLLGLVRPANESRMSRARHWRGVCRRRRRPPCRRRDRAGSDGALSFPSILPPKPGAPQRASAPYAS
jgi:hypothetical protein